LLGQGKGHLGGGGLNGKRKISKTNKRRKIAEGLIFGCKFKGGSNVYPGKEKKKVGLKNGGPGEL